MVCRVTLLGTGRCRGGRKQIFPFPDLIQEDEVLLCFPPALPPSLALWWQAADMSLCFPLCALASERAGLGDAVPGSGGREACFTPSCEQRGRRAGPRVFVLCLSWRTRLLQFQAADPPLSHLGNSRKYFPLTPPQLLERFRFLPLLISEVLISECWKRPRSCFIHPCSSCVCAPPGLVEWGELEAPLDAGDHDKSIA